MHETIWDEAYSVNIAEIDRQHRHFTGILDSLFEAIEEGRSRDVLAGILEELIEYVGYHFNTEEKLMARHGYPDYEAHHQEHEVFCAKLVEFEIKFREAGETLASDMAKFMTHWITEHVSNTDKKYSPFLNAKGVF